MQVTSIKFNDYNIFNGELDVINLSQKTIINTINQYSYCIAKQDEGFKQALIQSDILLPDGVGVVVAVKAIANKKIKKISGADLHFHLLSKLNETNGSCFYLGSSENTLSKIKQHLDIDYPAINSNFFSPPFKSNFSQFENKEMISKINSINPDVLFVGMTAPKQEKWVHAHKHLINANVICSIGAVFDFYAGTVKRPDQVWINLGLEWFVRLCNEPKRMWKRYLYYGPQFIFALTKEMVKADLSAIAPSYKKIL